MQAGGASRQGPPVWLWYACVCSQKVSVSGSCETIPVLVLLASVGVALVAIGALVLLRFPDRPGGKVRLLGLEVSSIGAGLPLVALGVLSVVLASGQQGGGTQTATSAATSGGGGQVGGPPPANTPACVTGFFDARPVVARGRRRALPAEVNDVEVLSAAEPKRQEFGLVLTDGGRIVGAAKMAYDIGARQFRFDRLVDRGCHNAGWTSPDQPGPNPSTVNNYTTLPLTLGDAQYTLHLKAADFVDLELRRFRP